MTISSVSYWKGGDHEAVVELMSQAGAVLKRHGAASHELSVVHAGHAPGQFVSVTRYPNWEYFGKAMQGLSEDAEMHALLAKIAEVSALTSHQIIASIDIPSLDI